MSEKDQPMQTTAERRIFLGREHYAALSPEAKIAYLALAIRAVATHVNEVVAEDTASEAAPGSPRSSFATVDVGSKRQ